MTDDLVQLHGRGEEPFEPIAIVGAGAIMPEADDLPSFWQNVLDARVSIRDLEEADDRWELEDYFAEGTPEAKTVNKTYSKIGAFVRGYEFDWRRYRLPPGSLRQIDDVQLWAVTTTAEALEDAGYMGEGAKELDRDRTGVVFANAQGGENKQNSNLRMDADRVIRLATNRGMTDPEGFREEMTRRSPLITEDTMPGELSNVVAGRVANLLDLRGPNYITDAACASSLAALLDGCRMLQARQVDTCIIGGSDRTMDPMSYVKFSAIGALSPTHSRPFDASADGFVMGEGAGAIVAKRLGDAIADGDRIYAVIRGIGASSDGKGKGITAPSRRGQQQAISRAYVQAGYGPETVELFEAHGTSTRVGDATELASVASLLDGKVPAGDHVAIGSIKSQIGHLKSAAGIASLLKTTLALHHATVPPSAGFVDPNPTVNWDENPLFVPTEAAEWPEREGVPRRAGVSSFGFGGTNFHVTLEAYAPEYHLDLARTWEGRRARWLADPSATTEDAASDVRPAPEAQSILDAEATASLTHAQLQAIEGGLLLLNAEDESALAARLEAVTAALLDPEAGPTFDDDPAGRRLSVELARVSAAYRPEGARLALVATSWAELTKRLALAAQGIEDAAKRGFLRNQMVLIETTPPAPAQAKVAHMYPGQGSQYVGMLEDLAARYDIVQETFGEADRTMRPILGDKDLTPFVFGLPDDPEARKQKTAALTATEICQPAMLTSDLALFRLLEQHGHRPDMVAGHSLGEYAALMVSGILSFHDALRAAAARGTEMGSVEVPDTGLMASVTAPYEVIEQVLESVDGYVISANKNSPQMTVIAGETAPVRAAIERFTELGVNSVVLPTSHAFHSRIVEPASKPLRRFLEGLEINLPSIPITSNYDGEWYPRSDPEDGDAKAAILRQLAPQMASSVEWTKQIETMYADGARIFLEVGPKRALAGFVPQILGDRPHVVANTNHPKQGGVATFLAALGVLAVSGRLPDGVPIPAPGAGFSEAFLAGPREAWASAAAAVAPAASESRLPRHPAVNDAEYADLRARARPLPSGGATAAPAAAAATAAPSPATSTAGTTRPARAATAAPGPAAPVAVEDAQLAIREQVHALVADASGYPYRHVGDVPTLAQMIPDAGRRQALMTLVSSRFNVSGDASAVATVGDLVQFAGGRLLTLGELPTWRPAQTPPRPVSPLEDGTAVASAATQGHGPAAGDRASSGAAAGGAGTLDSGRLAFNDAPVITGVGLGLPGGSEVFDPDNLESMLRGENRITQVPQKILETMLAKGVRKLVKDGEGRASFQLAETVDDLPQLAGQRAHFDLAEQYGIDPAAVRAFDIATQLSFACGLEALRDAGIPLTPVEKIGKGGRRLITGWELPKAYRDTTGVIFGSTFPGLDSAVRHVNNNGDSGEGQFDRRYLFQVLPMGHSQFAQWIGARGPNTAVNTACASTTHAFTIAEDWLRLGRCERVIIVSGDDVTNDATFEWVGSGFAASGAATIEPDVTKAALPFDKRRSGLILGMGAAALVLEKREAAAERGVVPYLRLLGAHSGNSAFHGTRLDTDHVAQQVAEFMRGVERRWGISAPQIAEHTAFMSHETYTPARGGSASAEIKALRAAFGESASKLIITNTKGFTGHPMGAGIEDAVVAYGLAVNRLPPIANFVEPDPELGDLRLSKGGHYDVNYALRLAAGFGSQLALAFFEGLAKDKNRIDGSRLLAWTKELAGTDAVNLRIMDRKLVAYVDGDSELLLKGMQGETFNPIISPANAALLTASPDQVDVTPRAVSPAAPAAAAPAPAAAQEVAPVTTPAPAATPMPAAAASSEDREAVTTKVIYVVVERTGYPADFIELDQDLEGELGIDTVKQAEIITELREHYGLAQDDSFLLSEYPTLGHVIDYLLAMTSGAAPAAAPAAPAAPAATPEPTAAPAAVASAPTAAPAPTAPSAAAGGDREGVTAKVIDVVVERTGYPADFIELDQDLEGELGIDTVKQAEIITELREHYGLAQDDSFLLSDYPTLGRVIDYLLSMTSGQAAPIAQATTPEPTPAEPTVRSAPATEPAPATPVPPATTGAAVDRAGVERKVLDVVVERTGYPEDFLELDQDLEGELGIDTVKQAEIITELREHYGLAQDDSFLLSDYPTLGHVIDYLVAMQEGGAAASPATADAAPSETTDPVRETVAVEPSTVVAPASPAPHRAGLPEDEVRPKVLSVVVERTGYPEDFLELDQDLEGELGIDTVKQAEIMAELREAFALPVDDSFLLAEHPTLGHIIRYICELGGPETAPDAGATAPASAAATVAAAPSVEPATPAAPSADSATTPLPPAAAASQTPRRWVVAAEAAPAEDPSPLALPDDGLVVLTGDDMGIADALTPLLQARGLRVARVELELNARGVHVAERDGAPAIRCAPGEPEQIEAACAALTEAGDVVGVLHLAPLTLATLTPEGPAAASAQMRVAASALFGLLRGLDAGFAARGTGLVASLTAVDGQHGAGPEGRFNSVAGGASGVVKAYARERPELRSRALDLHPELLVDPQRVAELVLAELDQAGPLEVGLDRQAHRWKLVLYPDELTADLTPLAEDDVWLVSGGGAGVTAASVIGLARASADANATFVLLGRTKLDASVADWIDEDDAAINARKLELRQQLKAKAEANGEKLTIVAFERAWAPFARSLEIHHTLHALSEAGHTATYVRCDVTDERQVREIANTAVARYGAITGILHGAGLEESKLVADKDPEAFERIVRVKHHGWHALWHAVHHDALRTVVAFTSVAGRFGNGGQTDYAAANNAVDLELRRIDLDPNLPRGLSIAWTGWQDVGMATRGSLEAIFAAAGIDTLPVNRGVAMFVNEVLRGGRSRIVACGSLGQMDDEDSFRGPRFDFPADVVAIMENARRFALIDQLVDFQARTRIVGQTLLDTSHHHFLTDHAISGVPYLPGVMALEMFAQHATMLRPDASLGGFDDASFGLPVKLVRGPVLVRVVAEVEEDSETEQHLWVRCHMESDLVNKAGEIFGEPRRHHQARVRMRKGGWKPTGERSAIPDVGIPGTGGDLLSAEAIYERFFHGPRFQSHGGITGALEIDGAPALDGIARMRHQLPEPKQLQEEAEGRVIWQESLPMLHEAAVQHAGLLAMEQAGLQALPVGIEQSILVRVPERGEVVRMRVLHRGEEEGGAVFVSDVVLVGEDDGICMVLRGCRLKAMAPLTDEQRFSFERAVEPAEVATSPEDSADQPAPESEE